MVSRVRAFDWLRGLAVLVMIQCHALVMLRPDLRSGPFFRKLNFADGLVAPAFLLAAGFSLGLVQVRSASFGNRGGRVRKTLVRILLEVLGLATLINAIWFFPIWQSPHRILRMDILQCVGLSLLLALPMVVALARRPRFLLLASLLLSIGAFAVAPLLEQVGVGSLAGQFLNRASDSPFPLFPWLGYVFLGISVGAVAAARNRQWLTGYLMILSVAGYGLYLLRDAQIALYPPHHFWETGPSQCAARIFWVGVVSLVFLWMEAKASAQVLAGTPVRFLETFGTSSLSAYFFHQAILYMLGPLSLATKNGFWRESLGWAGYCAATTLLVVVTYGAVRIWDALPSVRQQLLNPVARE